MLDNDKWRLGHHRPWWQWNVLTLAAALFVLVWARELFDIHERAFPIAFFIFFIWLIFPVAVPEPARPLNADPFLDDASPPPPNSTSPPASNNSTTTSATND